MLVLAVVAGLVGIGFLTKRAEKLRKEQESPFEQAADSLEEALKREAGYIWEDPGLRSDVTKEVLVVSGTPKASVSPVDRATERILDDGLQDALDLEAADADQLISKPTAVQEEPELRLAAVAGEVPEKERSSLYQGWVRDWGKEEADRLWDLTREGGRPLPDILALS